MYKLEDIIEDLKTEKPEVSVWEVIECLEQAQDTISDLEAKVEERDKDSIAVGRNVKEMVREFDVERIERINYAKELEAKVEELTDDLNKEADIRRSLEITATDYQKKLADRIKWLEINWCNPNSEGE